jgi:hypothetical protein
VDSTIVDLHSMMQRDNVEARCNASDGYDLPPYAKLNDFKIWEEVEPPKGTVFTIGQPSRW